MNVNRSRKEVYVPNKLDGDMAMWLASCHARQDAATGRQASAVCTSDVHRVGPKGVSDAQGCSKAAPMRDASRVPA